MSIIWIALYLAPRRALQAKTQLYRTLETLGRWSYLDPFSVMIFAPILQFGPIAHVTLGGGGPAFLAVLVITTLAVSRRELAALT